MALAGGQSALGGSGVFDPTTLNPGGVNQPYPGPAPGPTLASPTPTASAPDVTPAAPPASTISFGGYDPNYKDLITSDPTYVAAQNAATAAQQTGDAQRRAAVRAAYVQYGGNMPDGWTDQYGDIDQATKDAASGNQFSTVANLKNNYAQSAEQMRRALAARGMLQSSDLTYGQDQLDRGFGQQQYDAANVFANQYNGAYNAYAGVLGNNAQNLAQGVQGAESNVEANPAYRPVAATTANYDSANSTKYGTAIYSVDNGDGTSTLYTSDGQVFDPSKMSVGSAATGGPTVGAGSPYEYAGGPHYAGVQM